MVLPHGLRRGDLPTPQKLRGFKHLQRAAVALGLLRGDPLRVQVAGLHFFGNRTAGALSDDLSRVAQVLHVQGRVFAGELAYGLRHAAQVLEGVVTGQHTVGVGGAGQQRRIDLRQIFSVGFVLCCTFNALAIGMAHAI